MSATGYHGWKTSTRSDIPALLDEAEQWKQQGNLNCAVALWEQVLELASGNVLARANLGIALVKLECWQQAVEHLTEVLTFDPALVEVWDALSIAYIKSGRLKEALSILNRALEMGQPTWHQYYHRGLVHTEMNNLTSALTDYACALNIEPAALPVLNNRGNIFIDLGNYQNAIRDFTCLLEQQPDDVVAYYNRGIAYLKQGKYEKAAQDFLMVIRLNPFLIAAHYNLACTYVRNGMTDDALRIVCDLLKRSVITRDDVLQDPDFQVFQEKSNRIKCQSAHSAPQQLQTCCGLCR